MASLLQLRSLNLSGTKISLSTLEFLAPLTQLTNVCLDGFVKMRSVLCTCVGAVKPMHLCICKLRRFWLGLRPSALLRFPGDLVHS